jgi:hypothetical protein
MFVPQEAIVQIYNRMAKKKYTTDDVIIGIPTPIADGRPSNSRVKVYPKAHTCETTGLLITYNRIHTSELGTLKIKKNGRVTVHDVLAELSATYLYEFKPEDIVNRNLPSPDADDNVVVVFEFEAHCLGYYSGTVIKTPESLAPGNAEKARIDRIAKLSQEFSSFEASIYNNATEAKCALGRFVRTDIPIGEPKKYWEIKIVDRPAFIGFGRYTTAMNQSGGVGSVANTWAINTATGKLHTNNTASDFIRPIQTNETVGLMLDSQNNTLSVVLHDVTVSKQVIVGSVPLVVMACGVDSMRSTLRFNFGQDPMRLAVPTGAKHGIYTLLSEE